MNCKHVMIAPKRPKLLTERRVAMEEMNGASLLLLMVGLGCVIAQTTTAQRTHNVGGSFGWDTPSNSTFYHRWASHRTFGVGDQLVFSYESASHTLIQVSKREDFDTCGDTNVTMEWVIGPTTVPLNATGHYYFFCGVGTHCEMGQKLHVIVAAKPKSNGHGHARKMLSSEPRF